MHRITGEEERNRHVPVEILKIATASPHVTPGDVEAMELGTGNMHVAVVAGQAMEIWHCKPVCSPEAIHQCLSKLVDCMLNMLPL